MSQDQVMWFMLGMFFYITFESTLKIAVLIAQSIRERKR